MVRGVMHWIDTHIHLDDERYIARDADLQFARSKGVGAWIVPSTTAARFPAVRAVTQNHSNTYAAYGLHPYFMAEHQTAHLELLEQWIIRESPIAIGECGLDQMIDNPKIEQQLTLFRAHLRLAQRYNLPLIIHARRALDLILREIRPYQGALRGVIHGFSGSQQQASQAMDEGFYLGFGGAFTYPRARRLQAILRWVPADRYLLETDGPYQPSASLARGALHRPQDLIYIAQSAAKIREEPLTEVLASSYNNSLQLFNID